MILLSVLWKRLKTDKVNTYLSSKGVLFFNKIWESPSFSSRSFFQKIFFVVLCVAEQFYLLGFHIHKFFKKNKIKSFPFKVLSIGNISAGGTGKSVLVRFLINELRSNGSIVLRGYKGKNEKSGDSFLVCDGEKLFCEVDFSGDEAFMLAKNSKVPVVVGRVKSKSCDLILEYSQKNNKKIDYVILDDGYQHHSINKDMEILLLDSRRPFENGHCLPAGRLREKDLSRADVVVLTHAESFEESQLVSMKKFINKKNPHIPIFAGKHAFSSFNDINFVPVSREKLLKKRFIIFAGIGSFQGFLDTIYNLEIEVVHTIEYPDHHVYSGGDIENIISYFYEYGAEGILTTQKDWQKIFSLLDNFEKERHFFYCLDIKFKFISKQDQDEFLRLVNSKI